MRSLPEEYQKDAICEVLLGKSIHNLRKRCSPLTEQKSQLVSSLEAKRNQGRGQYYDRAIQNQITKQQARAFLIRKALLAQEVDSSRSRVQIGFE